MIGMDLGRALEKWVGSFEAGRKLQEALIPYGDS